MRSLASLLFVVLSVVSQTPQNYIAIDPVDEPGTPYLEVRGDADDINIGVRARGSGEIWLDGNVTRFRGVLGDTSLVVTTSILANNHFIFSSAIGAAPSISVEGASSTIDINVIPKGSSGRFTVNDEPVPVYNNLSVFSAGTVYSLTTTAALLDFGTTDPSVTINKAGTYLLMARVNLQNTGATYLNSRTVTLKVRRTNNTAADITNGTIALGTRVITAQTGTMEDSAWQTLYTTTNTDDILQLWGSISTVPSAGSLDATEASIVAVRVSG